MLNRWIRYAAPAAGLVLFAVALIVLRRELAAYHYRDIASLSLTIPHRPEAEAIAGFLGLIAGVIRVAAVARHAREGESQRGS